MMRPLLMKIPDSVMRRSINLPASLASSDLAGESRIYISADEGTSAKAIGSGRIAQKGRGSNRARVLPVTSGRG